MKLYLKTLGISVKYTFKAAALPFAALLLCLLFVLFALPEDTQSIKPTVGILCLDDHPLVPMLTAAVTASPEVREVIDLRMLLPGDPVDGLAAVVTLPRGFTDSILRGENLSPTVQLGSSGLSAVYVRELCTAVERYLSSAQAGIYAALEVAGDAPPERLDALVTDINLRYITLFLNRLSMLSKSFHSYDSLYMLRCGAAVLLFLLCGALGGAVPPLMSAARSMRGIKWSGGRMFAGGTCGVFLCCFAVVQLCCAAAFGVEAWSHPLASLILAALLGAVSFFFFGAAGGRGTASVLLCGFTLVTALLSGLIIPMEILPEALTRLAPLLPIYHVGELLTVLSGGYAPSACAAASVHAALWLCGGGLAWRMGVRRV